MNAVRIVAVISAFNSLLACACSADPSTASAPVTIRYKFTQGQVLTYNMSMDMATAAGGMMSPIHTNSTSVMTETVQSVAPDGSATVTMSSSDTKMTMNGKAFDLPDKLKNLMPSMSLLIGPTGKILSMSLGNGAPVPTGGTGLGDTSALGEMAVLPDQAVKVGDIWRSSSTGPYGMSQFYKMALIGLQQAGGSNIAQTHFKMFGETKPGGAKISTMKMDLEQSGSGETDFDIDAGNVKSSTNTVTTKTTTTSSDPSSVIPTIHTDMTMTTTISRVDN